MVVITRIGGCSHDAVVITAQTVGYESETDTDYPLTKSGRRGMIDQDDLLIGAFIALWVGTLAFIIWLV